MANWSIAYLFRSEAYRDLFHRTKAPSDLHHALDDFHLADALAPNSGLHREIGFVLHLHALQFGREFPEKVSTFELNQWEERCENYISYFKSNLKEAKGAEGCGYVVAYLREMGRTLEANQFEQKLEGEFSEIHQLKCSILFGEGKISELHTYLNNNNFPTNPIASFETESHSPLQPPHEPPPKFRTPIQP